MRVAFSLQIKGVLQADSLSSARISMSQQIASLEHDAESIEFASVVVGQAPPTPAELMSQYQASKLPEEKQ